MQLDTMAGHTILVVDDDAAFRGAAAIALSDAGYRVLEAGTPDEADALLRDEACALVLVDIQMQGNRKLEWLEQVAAARPRVAFVLCTGYPSLESAMHAVRLPVRGYLVKPVDTPTLTREVSRVLGEATTPALASVERLASDWGLTARETEVFHEVARGAANKAIAAALGCSLRTVELHVSMILRKSDSASRAVLLSRLAAHASSG